MTHVLAFFALFTVLQDVRRKMWPEQARRDLFIKYLKDTYDYRQRECIEVSGVGGGSFDCLNQPPAHQIRSHASSFVWCISHHLTFLLLSYLLSL